MISLEEVMQLHNKSIQDYGGSYGTRDINLLESAIARPYQSFGDVEFYPTPFEKAAAIIESIVRIILLLTETRELAFLPDILCYTAVE